MERHKATPSGFIILERDNKILLIRRKNTGYQDGNYGLPSGHLNEGELPSQCAIREAKEEVGVTINKLEFIGVVYNTTGDKGDYVDFLFKALEWEGEPENLESEKCDDIGWFLLNELPENLAPEIRAGLENYKKGEFYAEI